MPDDTELYEELIDRANGLELNLLDPIYSLHKSLVISLIAAYCTTNNRQDVTDDELAAAIKGAANDAIRDFDLRWDEVISPAIKKAIPTKGR